MIKYLSLLRKKYIFFFAVLIFSLYVGAYIVVYRQVMAQSGEPSGICLIRNGHTNLKGFADPDIGKGYAKVGKLGVYTFAGIRSACTKSDFEALLRSYCVQNPTDAEQYGPEAVGFDKEGRFLASGGCPGCDEFGFQRCPVLLSPADSKAITYPIPELGGCSNTKECYAYCEKPENNRACFVFVKKHNLVSKDELDKWEEFLDVASGEGPGGCKNEKECINYCEDVSHIVECTDFVAKHNLVSSQELIEMQKIAKAVKAGVKLPGSCRNKAECISYCEDSDHNEECVSFLEKAGYMTEKEASLVRKFKGKSPGDCAKGKESFADAQISCNEFCNNPTNQPICFRFLQEAGIMTAEEATQAGSLSDFQSCIPSAPLEIQKCFIDNLGQELFEAMKQGVLPLVGDIEDFMAKIRLSRACINRYADQSTQTFTDDPDALSCINSELGADYLQRASHGEIKCGDAAPAQEKIISCVEEKLGQKLDHCFSLACSDAITCIKGIQKRSSGMDDGGVAIKPETLTKLENKFNTCIAEDLRICLSKDCGEAISCIQKIQSGSEGENKGDSNIDSSLKAEITAKFTVCLKDQQSGGAPQSLEQPQGQPQAPAGTPYEIPITSELCANFSSAPQCSYVGSPDSQNYQLCKKCYPDR